MDAVTVIAMFGTNSIQIQVDDLNEIGFRF